MNEGVTEEHRKLEMEQLTALTFICTTVYLRYKKSKAVPLQAWSGPEGSRKLKVPRVHDNGTEW
jgi:hypothetical protein